MAPLAYSKPLFLVAYNNNKNLCTILAWQLSSLFPLRPQEHDPHAV